MPYGGNDWLALTQEATLEPELPICDPHHHFWDFRSERVPYQRYLLHELVADVGAGHNVRSTVFIEARAMYRAGRTGGAAPGRRGRVRPGPGRRQRQRRLWPVPGGGGDRRPRRSEARRPGRAGAGGAQSRKPEPVSRHPPYGHLGPASRDREPREGKGAGDRRIPGRRAGTGADGAVARHRCVLSATPGAGRLRQSRARSDDHPEPSRRPDADRPLRQSRR